MGCLKNTLFLEYQVEQEAIRRHYPQLQDIEYLQFGLPKPKKTITKTKKK